MRSKYGRFICTDIANEIDLPVFRAAEQGHVGQSGATGKRQRAEHVAWIDDNTIPGAFYCEAVWYWPQVPKEIPIRRLEPGQEKDQPIPAPHSHPFPELLSYFGTNLDDPGDLGGLVEFWLEDEKYLLDRSFVVYIPEGITHCPLKVLEIARPTFHFTAGPGQLYR